MSGTGQEAREALWLACDKFNLMGSGDPEAALDALLAAVRAERTAEIVEALREAAHGNIGSRDDVVLAYHRAADFVAERFQEGK